MGNFKKWIEVMSIIICMYIRKIWYKQEIKKCFEIYDFYIMKRDMRKYRVRYWECYVMKIELFFF